MAAGAKESHNAATGATFRWIAFDSMTCSWRWFIHPETAISKNRNGSSTLCVFKTHYRDRRAAVAKYRIFMQIQFSDHTPWGKVSV
jgi:hypothetical protein